MNMRIFIYAGTFNQAHDFTRKVGMYPTDWVYLQDARQLRGVRTIPFVRIGTWYERKDSREIEMLLEVNEMVELDHNIFTRR